MYSNERKLALKRETLRNLQDSDLTCVVGGKGHRDRRKRPERPEYFEIDPGTSRTCQPDQVVIGGQMVDVMNEEMQQDWP